MGRSFHLLLAASILHLPTPAQEDPKINEALYRLSREASKFWQAAPGFIGQETIDQRVLVFERKRIQHPDTPDGRRPVFKTRQITSWYVLGSFRGSPEAIREFRQIFSIDGKRITPDAAKAKLARALSSKNDDDREDLLKDFESRVLPGAATDFGQLLLLFSKSKQDKYSFRFAGEARVGADAALVIAFKQVGGKQALQILDGNKKVAAPLQGELAVRQGDYLPLRITLTSNRTEKKKEIRDEAIVEYGVTGGALLPASVIYRSSVDGTLTVENTYRYSAWEPLKK